jgi:hypothetical protein
MSPAKGIFEREKQTLLASLWIVRSWLAAIMVILQKGTWFKRQSICHVVVSSEVCGLFVYFILSLNVFF